MSCWSYLIYEGGSTGLTVFLTLLFTPYSFAVTAVIIDLAVEFTYIIGKQEKEDFPQIEQPSSNRTLKIASILVAAFWLSGAWWIWSAPEYQTYDNYGFSFKYPSGSSISEEEIKGYTTCYNIGKMNFKSESTSIILIWVTNPDEHPPMDETLRTFEQEYSESFDEVTVLNRVDTELQEFPARYYHIKVKLDEERSEIIVGVWYTENPDRMYLLITIAESGLAIFTECLNSFEFSHVIA